MVTFLQLSHRRFFHCFRAEFIWSKRQGFAKKDFDSVSAQNQELVAE
jgi:hypothetical protein